MHSPRLAPDAPLRRHDLVFVSRASWRALMRARQDLAAVPGVAGWVDRGWPLAVRRPDPGEMQGLALGLPLPPTAGKRRLAIVMQAGDIAARAAPLKLADARAAAPPNWRPTLARLADLALRNHVDARVFGGLAWQALTGTAYLSKSSDLDLLVPLRPGCDPGPLVAELASIARSAPMRLDGELVRVDGAAVSWQELHTGAAEVLVKTLAGVKLMTVRSFITEGAAP